MAFDGTKITWFYTAGYDRGSANIYLDNVFKESINANMPQFFRRQIGKTWTVFPGAHRIEVRLTGGGYIDIDSFSVDIPTVGSGSYDDPDAQFRYIGGPWNHAVANGAYNNTQSATNVAGSLFRFTFYGTSVQYVFSKAYNRGVAAVTIDNVDKGTIDMYDPGVVRQQSVTYSGLGVGTHIINVNVTGTRNNNSSDVYVDVDRLIVQ